MKVLQDFEDRAGRYPLVFPKSATIQQIYDWLWGNGFQGYRFLIQIPCNSDGYVKIENTFVYFADELLEEEAYFADYEIKKIGGQT